MQPTGAGHACQQSNILLPILLQLRCAEVEAMVESKEQGVVLVCNLGGVLELQSAEKPGLKQQSRSLIAAYQIHRAGFKNIKVLAGGMSRWLEEERDVWVPGEAVSDSGSEQDAADDAVPGV